jgi:hypothetical protein
MECYGVSAHEKKFNIYAAMTLHDMCSECTAKPLLISSALPLGSQRLLAENKLSFCVPTYSNIPYSAIPKHYDKVTKRC